MTQHELVTELRGEKCRCGKVKRPMQTFCRFCYYRLPQDVRNALYRRVGEGYEQAYEQAAQLLDGGIGLHARGVQ